MGTDTVICCDDEIVLPLIADICRKNNYQIISENRVGEKAYNIVCKEKVNLLILGIELADGNGIDIAKKLIQDHLLIKVIFISENKKFLADAFKVYAYDYIHKDDLKTRLPESLKRIKEELSIKNKKMIKNDKAIISKGGQKIILFKKEISYIKSVSRKLNIVTDNQIHTLYDSLKNWEMILDNRFIKCHRSFLVNIDKVRCFNRKKRELEINNGETIPVSKGRIRNLEEVFTNF